jgi:hypothetical protein
VRLAPAPHAATAVGARALLTHGRGNEAPDPSESFNVGAVRVEWSLAESALGDDCYLSGLATG